MNLERVHRTPLHFEQSEQQSSVAYIQFHLSNDDNDDEQQTSLGVGCVYKRSHEI